MGRVKTTEPVVAAGTPPVRLKMKDLERATGVGRETIRFYIREGLLPEPERPGRNVAWYDESFIERIQLIKKLQDERFLPLAVIKSIVAPHGPLSAAEEETLRALQGEIRPSTQRGRAARGIDVATLARRAGIPLVEIREFARHGAITLERSGDADLVRGNDIEIIELWGRLRAAGFTQAVGITTDLIPLYVEVIDWLTGEEIKIFTRALTGRVDFEGARLMAEEGIDVVNRLLGLMHERRILQRLTDISGRS